jgi:putative hemolysin
LVHVRDLLAAARRGGQTTVFQLARPVLGVPENKVLGPLLQELRERKEQLAVVLGEYGAVAGIVTVEDILEELVGEIDDEFDLPDARITRLDDRTVLVSGALAVDDFNEMLGARLPEAGLGRSRVSSCIPSAAAPIPERACRSMASRFGWRASMACGSRGFAQPSELTTASRGEASTPILVSWQMMRGQRRLGD